MIQRRRRVLAAVAATGLGLLSLLAVPAVRIRALKWRFQSRCTAVIKSAHWRGTPSAKNHLPGWNESDSKEFSRLMDEAWWHPWRFMAVQELIRGTSDPGEQWAYANIITANGAGHLEDPTFVSSQVEILRRSTIAAERVTAADALSNLPSPAGWATSPLTEHDALFLVSLLRNSLRTDEFLLEARSLLVAVGRLNVILPEFLSVAAEIARTETEPEYLRLYAMSDLVSFGTDREAISSVHADVLLNSGSELTREAASALPLRWTRVPPVTAEYERALEHAAHNDPSDKVRAMAEKSLRKLGR